MEEKLTAINIRASLRGEGDSLVSLFTLEKGKITAVMKGVKKNGAKLKVAAQPFCLGEYIITGHGNIPIVIGADVTEQFYELRLDIEKYYAACVCLEICDKALVFEQPNPRLFMLLLQTLKELCFGVSDSVFLLSRFCFGALEALGFALSVDFCRVCGKKITAQDAYLNREEGFLVCVGCGGGLRLNRAIFDCLAGISESISNLASINQSVSGGDVERSDAAFGALRLLLGLVEGVTGATSKTSDDLFALYGKKR